MANKSFKRGVIHVPVEVKPTSPPSMAVRVLETDLLVGPSNQDLNVAYLIALSGNMVISVHGVPSHGEPAVPTPLTGYSPLAAVRVRRGQVVIQECDIEMIDATFVSSPSRSDTP